jgi:hypothetical protein
MHGNIYISSQAFLVLKENGSLSRQKAFTEKNAIFRKILKFTQKHIEDNYLFFRITFCCQFKYCFVCYKLRHTYEHLLSTYSKTGTSQRKNHQAVEIFLPLGSTSYDSEFPSVSYMYFFERSLTHIK